MCTRRCVAGPSERGQSLQEYLLQLLCEQARTETLEELLQRAGGRAGGNIGREAAVAAVRADRDGL